MEYSFDVSRLGDYCIKVGSGATPKGGKEVYLESGEYSLIRSQNVLNNRFATEGLAYISKKAAEKLSSVSVETEDVLLNITGDSVARCCSAPPYVLPARVNQHVAIIRPDPAEFVSRFVRYFLVSPIQQDHMLKLASSGATRNALTKGMVEDFIIPKPDIRIQRAIVKILGDLDDKIVLLREMNRTLEEIARAVFRAWFVDFAPVRAKASGATSFRGMPQDLFDTLPNCFEQSEIGEIPNGWMVRDISDIASLNPESWSRSSYPEIINYVDLSNTKWGRIEATNLYSKEDAPSRAQRVLRPGDTIVGTVRPGNGSYALISRHDLTGSTGFAVLRPKHHQFREVVYLATTSPENIGLLAHLADGGAYPAIRPNVVAETKIVSGPNVVFGAFSTVTSALIDRAEANKDQAEKLASLRDTLLPKLMAGELEAPSLEALGLEGGE